MTLVYLTGAPTDADAHVSEQLARLSDGLTITNVASPADALAEIRRSTGSFRMLLVSPALAEQEALSAIGFVRQQEPAVAILPVVRDPARSNAMLTAGASDVLLFAGGTLVDSLETLARATRDLPAQAESLDAEDGRPTNGVVGVARRTVAGIRKVHSVFYDRKPRDPASESGQPQPESGAARQRRLLELRLNQARAAAERQIAETIVDAPPAADAAAMEPPRAIESDASSHGAPQASGHTVSAPPSQQQADAGARADLEVALEAARAKLQEAAAVHASERTAWEAERQDLEARLRETDAKTDALAELEAALGAARAQVQLVTAVQEAEREAWNATRAEFDAAQSTAQAELQRTISAHGSERQTWLNELEAAADARAVLETALAKAEAEQHQVNGTHLAERAAWDATRQELEAATWAARAELQQTVDAHGAERAAWDATRQELEAAVGRAQAAATQAVEGQQAQLEALATELAEATEGRATLEATLQAAQATERQLAETHASERDAWAATRQELEAAVGRAQAAATQAVEGQQAQLEALAAELVEATEGRATLEATLQAAQATERQAAETHASERDVWAATRQELEAATSAARAELQRTIDAHAAERAAWDATRQELEAAMGSAQAAAAQAADARQTLDAALVATRAELQQATEARAALEARLDEHGAAVKAGAALESALNDTRAELTRLAETHVADRLAWQAAREPLEARLRELEEAADQRQELASALKVAWADLQQALTAREELAARVTELQEAADARERLEAALTSARTDLQVAVGTHTVERTVWEATRELLEARVRDGAPGRNLHSREETPLEAHPDDRELLAAYRALEARLRETTSRLQLLRREADAQHGAPASASALPLTAGEHLQARRIEEVGALAAAMVPDITDLVTSIDDDGTPLSRELAESDPQRACVERILEHSRQATGLLQQLRAFIDKQTKPLVTLDLNDAVGKAEPMLAQVVGADVDFRVVLGPTATVTVGEDDFELMLTTLVFAARDLLTVGGSVVIETSSPNGDAVDEDPHANGAADRYRLVTVTASGYGVQRARPSFALELAVRRCGGTLSVGDDWPRTSLLRVVLPLARPPSVGNRDDHGPAALLTVA